MESRSLNIQITERFNLSASKFNKDMKKALKNQNMNNEISVLEHIFIETV